MVSAISSSFAAYAITAEQSQKQAAVLKAPQQSDSVELSPVAQAVAMQKQGLQVKTIAADLGVTAQTVDSYLGIASGGGGAGNGNALSRVESVAAHTKVLGPSQN